VTSTLCCPVGRRFDDDHNKGNKTLQVKTPLGILQDYLQGYAVAI